MKAVALTVVILLTATTAHAIDVAITDPGDGSTVSGTITVTGTSQDVGAGLVSVSIDAGPFQPAQGLDPWTFAWETGGVPDGPHTITARARQCIQCTAVFASVDVIVSNGDSPFVSITSPSEGAVIVGTLVVQGTSSGATEVSLQIDGGPFQVANGIESWNVVIEQGVLPPGPHTLTARAIDGARGEAFDAVSITASDPAPGVQTITYFSSIDGEPMTAKLYLPQNFDPLADEIALICHLHGGGGLGSVSLDLQAGADARNWIVIAPDGRQWGLADPASCPQNPNAIGQCAWCTSAAYVDNPFDPRVGPGEQDIFDAIDWAIANFNVDTARIYLTGFSMGGRGTYNIGLKNPDRFAAIVPRGPAIDMYEIFVRRPEPTGCKEGMVSGAPEDAPHVDTMYSITSGRFLIENAYNLPVFHGHGTLDTIANNDPTNAPFLHGRHILMETSWDACHEDTALCFGHTPTLSELHARHPDGYDWAFMFTPVAHTNDSLWFTGAPIAAGREGVEDPENPGNLIGIFDFLDDHTLQTSPETIVFKSYTDTHRRAYWTQIDITTPWLDLPGAIRATRTTASNTFDLELVRVETVTIDVSLAQLELAPGSPLTVTLALLDEPVYDPGLAATGETLAPTLILDSDFSGVSRVVVLRDGVGLPDSQIALTESSLAIGPLVVTAATTLVIEPVAQGDVDGDGVVGIIDLLVVLGAWGPCPSPPAECPADVDGDDTVGITDFLIVLANWS